MSSPTPTPLRDVDWACRRLGGVGRDSVYGWVRTGILPHCRLGRRVFFDEDEIERFIRSGGKGFGEADSEEFGCV